MKRDKQRVEGEQWSEDQLRMYLDFNTYDGTDRDFHCIYRAYTRMNEETFAAFVALFKAEGRNPSAKNKSGQTLADIIQGHQQAHGYLDTLQS